MSRLPTTADALFVVAVFSRHAAVITETRHRLEALFGPIGLTSEPYLFHHTRYYEKTMGPDLVKQFFAFEQLVALDSLARRKRLAIQLEGEIQQKYSGLETRVVNIDPGLLNLGKFMLATTKDQAHRLYLGEGIFAEVTLRFADGSWEPWPWTYADYREPKVRMFLKTCREFYKQRLQTVLRQNPDNVTRGPTDCLSTDESPLEHVD